MRLRRFTVVGGGSSSESEGCARACHDQVLVVVGWLSHADTDRAKLCTFERPDGGVQVCVGGQRRVVDVYDPVTRDQTTVNLSYPFWNQASHHDHSLVGIQWVLKSRIEMK